MKIQGRSESVIFTVLTFVYPDELGCFFPQPSASLEKAGYLFYEQGIKSA